MKLDRNTNRGGRGKYALVNMRKLIPMLEREELKEVLPLHIQMQLDAFKVLLRNGIITLGNETPGDQFFVMKYKDKFTAAGLRGYAWEVRREADKEEGRIHPEASKSLLEYSEQILQESYVAQNLGKRIPD